MLTPFPNDHAILDVGCLDTPVATWGNFARRYTCDIEHDPQLPGVVSVVEDFLSWRVPERMHVITCCQVLEHLSDDTVQLFTDKLMESADHVIVSVPYEWPKGTEADHQQDPISFEKLARLMGREPDERVVVLDTRHNRVCGLWYNQTL
jgi:hypothetical protein